MYSTTNIDYTTCPNYCRERLQLFLEKQVPLPDFLHFVWIGDFPKATQHASVLELEGLPYLVKFLDSEIPAWKFYQRFKIFSKKIYLTDRSYL